MAVALQAKVTLKSLSGIPADNVVNTFAFYKGTSIDSTERSAIATAIADFYRSPGPSRTNCVADWLGWQLSRGAQACEIDIYEAVTGGMGSPLSSHTFTLNGDLSDSNLPAECAVTLSFHADLSGVAEEAGATRPKARRRGRIYLGPLTNAAVTNDSNHVPYVNATLMADVAAAAEQLIDDSAAAGVPWAVWSRTDNLLRPVVGGWVDDAFDTIRSRGHSPTTRVTFS